LEDLDRKVSEKVPKPQVSKGVEMKGYDAEVEEVQALPLKTPRQLMPPWSLRVPNPVDLSLLLLYPQLKLMSASLSLRSTSDLLPPSYPKAGRWGIW